MLGIDDLNDYYDPRIKEWRLSTLSSETNFEFHKLDIRDYDPLKEILRGKKTEATINLA